MHMRRLFVIFLALLFPLNVYALSMSVSSLPVSSMHGAGAHEAVAAMADITDVAGVVGEADFDIDPDEPPAGVDFHDTVSAPPRLLLVVPADTSIAELLPARRGRDPLPPIKPPPAA
jgi:hypothetical protein